jgi:hypothetical protein
VSQRFEFEFSSRVRPAALAFGVTARNSNVEVTHDELQVTFGLWRFVTSLSNVAGVGMTGPYSWLKVAGPPHLSLSDRGITFATTTERGVCVELVEPVAMKPSYARIRHPGVTLTVGRPEELIRLLR